MQVVPPGGQISYQCKYRHLVAEFQTNACGTIYLLNLLAIRCLKLWCQPMGPLCLCQRLWQCFFMYAFISFQPISTSRYRDQLLRFWQWASRKNIWSVARLLSLLVALGGSNNGTACLTIPAQSINQAILKMINHWYQYISDSHSWLHLVVPIMAQHCSINQPSYMKDD